VMLVAAGADDLTRERSRPPRRAAADRAPSVDQGHGNPDRRRVAPSREDRRQADFSARETICQRAGGRVSVADTRRLDYALVLVVGHRPTDRHGDPFGAGASETPGGRDGRRHARGRSEIHTAAPWQAEASRRAPEGQTYLRPRGPSTTHLGDR
jgi:hypothetical protein